jgi:hypothetical protein
MPGHTARGRGVGVRQTDGIEELANQGKGCLTQMHSTGATYLNWIHLCLQRSRVAFVTLSSSVEMMIQVTSSIVQRLSLQLSPCTC